MLASITKFELIQISSSPAHLRVLLDTDDPRNGVPSRRETLLTFIPRLHPENKNLLVGATGPVFATDLTGLAINSPKDLDGESLLGRHLIDLSIAWMDLIIASREELVESQLRLSATDVDEIDRSAQIQLLQKDIADLKTLRDERIQTTI